MKNYTIYYQQIEKVFDEKENKLENKIITYKHEATKEETKILRFWECFFWYLFAFITFCLPIFAFIFGKLDDKIVSCIICGLIGFFFIGGGIFSMINCEYYIHCEDYDKDNTVKYFVNKYFKYEYFCREEMNKLVEDKAKQWREEHSLEEKCRLAMTKNPNYVADLIRYIKKEDEI